MMAVTVIIAWLMVLKIIASSLCIFLSHFLFLLGVVFVLTGSSYNTRADRND